MEDSIKSEVNRREVYRYLGLGRHDPDERTALLVEESLVELENAVHPDSFLEVTRSRFFRTGNSILPASGWRAGICRET